MSSLLPPPLPPPTFSIGERFTKVRTTVERGKYKENIWLLEGKEITKRREQWGSRALTVRPQSNTTTTVTPILPYQ